MYWSEFWEFVKRNMLTIVLVAVVAVSFPMTLIFIIPIAAVVLYFQMMVWRVQRGIKNQQHDEFNHEMDSSEVKIVRTEPTEQRVNDNVGEYVDFKEITEEETQK